MLKNLYERIVNNKITTFIGVLLLLSGLFFLQRDKTEAGTFLISTGVPLILMKDNMLTKNKNNTE